MRNDNFIPIDNVLLRNEVITTEFACDLKACKGACCTFESSYGAPLLEEEVDKINEILPEVKKNLSGKHIDVIERKGFYEVVDGELVTRSINNRACVFVYYEDDIAKCGIEKSFNEGKTDFRKPISCHLFPIRVSDFGGDVLRFEKFSQCSPALEKGKELKINLVDFCRGSLERLYGKKWYLKLKEIIK